MTYLSGAILEVNLSLLGQESQIQDIQMQDDNDWIDSSAIVHVTPIPECLVLNEITASFSDNFSFYFSDELTPQGLVFVHSGYAFGGQRGGSRYSEVKT